MKAGAQPQPVTTTSQQNMTQHLQKNIESRWARLDIRAKKFVMIFGSAISFALALLYGPTIFYLLIFVIGSGAYALYPEKIDNWIDNHQFLLGFAAFGAILSGPLGFVAGAWLGNFLEPSNNRFTATAAAVYQYTPTLLPATNRPSLWQRIKNNCYNSWLWIKKTTRKEASSVTMQPRSGRITRTQAHAQAARTGEVITALKPPDKNQVKNSDNIRDNIFSNSHQVIKFSQPTKPTVFTTKPNYPLHLSYRL